jgi:glutathione S-transferase
MITLYQHPVSPFCITIEAILKYAKTDYRIVNIPLASDRRTIVEKSKGQSYKIPLLEDGDTVIWDNTDLGQEIARYLETKFRLGLFPLEQEGLQAILARYIENDVESVSFKLNDIHYESWLPDLYDRMMWFRHKERKFGPGCVTLWQSQKEDLQSELEGLLTPIEQMLSQRPFLIGDTPRFVDFDLFGILGNYTFSGHNAIPSRLTHLQRWHEGMKKSLRCL